MAIMHLSASIIKRSEGRSSIAASAYRACTKLHDQRQNIEFDYSKKQGLVFEAILLPKHAPSRFSDRSTLWNEVERIEKRKDSRLAREVQIALPLELTDEQNWTLAQDYIQQQFVDKGMIADVAFHAGHGSEQPHVHVMLTLREVTEQGFGLSARHWNDRALVTEWRKGWAELCNQHLALHGHDVRIDHRSNEERGINLIPQTKIGVSASGAKRDIKNGNTPWVSDRMAEHEAIAKTNGERLIANPDIALTALSGQQSTFSDADIARLANRQSIDNDQFADVYHAILASPNLISLGKNAKGEMRYTSRELLEIESGLIAKIETMAKHQGHPVSAQHSEKAIKDKTLSPSQAAVLEALVHGSDAIGVVGFAGTGKTHLLGAARQAWEAQGYTVRGLALAGKAADGLVNEAGIDSRTIASRLLAWENGRERIMRNDVLVIDEAGMVDSRLLKAVIDVAENAGAKVVLVGDHTQLQPIGAGAAFRAILQRIGFASLTDIRRQKTAWMTDASKQFALGQTKEALLAYHNRGYVHAYATQEEALTACVASWWDKRTSHPERSATMTAFMRKDVLALNLLARQQMREAHLLGNDIPCIIDDGRAETTRSFAVGDAIYFLKNDKGLDVSGIDEDNIGVKNGSRGIITAIKEGLFTVALTQGSNRSLTFDIKDYNHIDYAYAATVHKLQGATFDGVDYFPSWNSNRYLSHVAMTRHKLSVDVHYSQEGFHHGLSSLIHSFGREAIKDFTLDYSQARHLEPSLVDVDGILMDEANGQKLDAWLAQVDFAALEATQAPQLMPLLHAKAQYDIIAQHYESQHDVYREAQTVLTHIALETKQAHEQHQVLQGLDKTLLTSLTKSHDLTALENSIQSQAKTLPQERPHPEQAFDAFLSGFDWKAIEANRDKVAALDDLHQTKVAYEKEKHLDPDSTQAEHKKNTMLTSLGKVVNNPVVEQQVREAVPSLVEPLHDYKTYQQEQEKSLADFKEKFDQWFDSVPWEKIDKPKNFYVENVVEEAKIYQKLRDMKTPDIDMLESSKNDLISDLGKAMEADNTHAVFKDLAPDVKTTLFSEKKAIEQCYRHEQSLAYEHSLDI